MIIRIVQASDREATDDTTERPIDTADDRARLARAAARITGLETLIVGWRAGDGERLPGGSAGPSVVVFAWLDVASMLVAMRADESTFLRERLGLDIAIDGAETYEVMSRTFGSLPTPSSILRVVTLRARSAGATVMFERLRANQERLTHLGLIGSHVARRVVPDGVEAIVVGVWRDQEAVDQATDGRPDRAAFAADIEQWIESVTVDSYRAIEIAPRLPMGAGPPILILDGDGRVVDLTPAAAAALGRTQEALLGLLIEELAAADDTAMDGHDSSGWSGLLSDDGSGDTTGQAAWPLQFGGHVLIHWRLRRDVPIVGRHTMLIRRRHEPDMTAADVDAAVAEAFRSASPGCPQTLRRASGDVLQVRLDLRHGPKCPFEIVVDRLERSVLDAGHLVGPVGMRLRVWSELRRRSSWPTISASSGPRARRWPT